MKRAIAGALVAALVACGKSDAPPPPASASTASAASGGSAACPATGLWAQCSVMYHLERAGLAPHLDSTATPTNGLLTGKAFVVKIGMNAVLEVYLYPDSSARIADEKKLDRSQFVNDTAAQTIKRERTLIESFNLVGLLTSLNSHQRQRVSDALTAGPPQPSKP